MKILRNKAKEKLILEPQEQNRLDNIVRLSGMDEKHKVSDMDTNLIRQIIRYDCRVLLIEDCRF